MSFNNNSSKGDRSSEKRPYLEPTSTPPSNAQPPLQAEHPDHVDSIGNQEDQLASSSSRVPPAYTDMDRGFDGGDGLSAPYPPNAHSSNEYPSYPPPQSGPYPPPQSGPYPPPMNSPPYNHPYQSPQPSVPLDEPICLTLLNPRLISSGFTMAMPNGLHRLAPRPVDSTKWTAFMQELNDVLHKAPGSVMQEISDFWLVHAVTLGLVVHARNMFQSRIEGKAAAVIERYNRAEFAAWGIRAHFDIVSVVDATASQSSSAAFANGGSDAQRHGSRQRRDDRRVASGTAHKNSTLELVIERA